MGNRYLKCIKRANYSGRELFTKGKLYKCVINDQGNYKFINPNFASEFSEQYTSPEVVFTFFKKCFVYGK